MNYEGLRRRGFSAERVATVKAMHRALYRDDLTLAQAIERIGGLLASSPESAPDVAMMQDFLSRVSPQRGIVR
jgi:UDP-N-acetylglucosamine acyltransferase